LIKRQAFIETEISDALKTPFKDYKRTKQKQKMKTMVDVASVYHNFIGLDYLDVVGRSYNWID
jgi:hypothetical protein